MITNNSELIIKNTTDFCPAHTFLCGQCFRWDEMPDGSFTGVAMGKVLNVSADKENIILRGTDKTEYNNIWLDYFDFGRDYINIKKLLSFKDEFLRSAISYGWGIHILKQDFFETLLSFIISANNNIPRIRGIIDALSRAYGEKISFDGKDYFAFPTPEQLYGIQEQDLAPFKMGYRAPYIASAVKHFSSLDKEEIQNAPINDARRILRSIKGVGPKVADCILLFSFGRFEVFPTDVWVKRVMGELYGCPPDKATAHGEALFGDLAGIAQQYLFYHRREGGNIA
ncbi:MAG: DNA-3-methyladenine glycosylase 2 family protein [Clostridia bacterium]|nr:DNA-3-methyladenine glycosylase 2 family protein [Clostridia bacterium]